MKNWETLEPDKYTLVGSHRYTKGRARPIDRIIIHHNAANNWSSEQVRDLWNNSREASAHYQVEADGTIGQLVNDYDTAWHAANADINARSIGIEHANISGPPRWQISDKTIEEGAHLVAALCHAYNLGRPQWGKNVFPHSRFTSTSCPHQLDVGGEDHATYMARAQWWYDNFRSKPAPAPKKEEGLFMALSEQEQREALDLLRRIYFELTENYQSRYEKDGVRSEFRDTAIGYALEADRKLEDMHANMLPAIYAGITDLMKKAGKKNG
ncbi:peptidoglycan recognition protein family protein [Corynebacterium tapiri]|uniref:N-acetylmuramoyl-L-alanine amidase n=1 Tax=Corynebacterium tapiri TaxID=1448266 RepID=A0A5C4U4Q4_9CORY|nr:peptidoglycan recognition family protein [Corynebacterium tapiri]TNL98765.1 N-acetylmuramoyl-L-alanine amidase [Corynebacterium tapiri]